MAQQANLCRRLSRTATGKGAARSLRRAGQGPGRHLRPRPRRRRRSTIDTAALNKMLLGISAGTTIVDVAVDGRAAGKGADPRDPAQSAPPGRDHPPRPVRGPRRREGHPRGADPAHRHPRRRPELRRRARPRPARARDRGAAGQHPGAHRARRHRARHRPVALRARPARWRRPRSSTTPTRRSAPSWRRATEEAPRRWSRRSPPTEPELIRKPKAEDEDETEPKV